MPENEKIFNSLSNEIVEKKEIDEQKKLNGMIYWKEIRTEIIKNLKR